MCDLIFSSFVADEPGEVEDGHRHHVDERQPTRRSDRHVGNGIRVTYDVGLRLVIAELSEDVS